MARTDFGKALHKFAEKVDGGIATVMRKSSIDLLSSIVMKTPVGNPTLWKSKGPPGYVGGRLRASWTVDFDQAVFTATLKPDPSGALTIANGATKLQQWEPGLPIVISTRLPYAPRIEFQGHSGQAPAGMVRVSVAEWHSFVERAARSLD
ncbi:hypothetical protein QFW80_04590 [Luteimonas sp. M1R5S18]|uniref:HK97 gp10 family phage protein n=1 Tax=Luteimonas rhizosphaericola TaxID=3042024 RepID=A0ABT6JGI8_9GAMM|nr:hypothetical protein [Luteimonas rhizosphaericola]MDH5829796.1 hypothetical protein [Luteimonas rhizosphaericola]